MSALDDFLNDDEEFLEGSTFHDLGEKYYYGVKQAATELARLRAVEAALTFLLSSRNCWSPQTGVEIPEQISAEFDIGLDGARDIAAALQEAK
jgi:hypothetical protein